MKSEIRILNGYRVILMPEHPKAMTNESWSGYVYEHIVVVEEYLGRQLRENEVVHHLDENRGNNRIENLLVIEESQHSKLHAWIDRGCPIVGGHKEMIITDPTYCVVCSRTVQKQAELYCSIECSAFTKRKAVRPNKKELANDIALMSFVEIGRKYGVTDNAIRKWARAYGIDTRRYKVS